MSSRGSSRRRKSYGREREARVPQRAEGSGCAKKLLEMARLDERVRSDLARRGVLFDGYHAEMEQVHNANADCLAGMIDEHGWPSKSLVGDEAAAAAWLIVQHAISKPGFQRSCLELLKDEAEKGLVEPRLIALLQDRIHVFEGKLQIYGTQFDWDDHGELSPKPIRDPENVNALRRAVGLPPLEEVVDQMRRRAAQEGDKAPVDIREREAKFLQWAKKVGWRK